MSDSGSSKALAQIGNLPQPHSLFWERLLPSKPTGLPPVLMLPGGAASGACFRATPDGRKGWADRFQALGHTVYTTDWPGQGRSGYIPSPQLSYEFAAEAMGELVRMINDPRLILFTHSMSGALGWKLLETQPTLLSAIIATAPAPPGNVQPQPVMAGTDPDQAAVAGEIVAEGDGFVHIRYRGTDFKIDFGAHAADVGDYLLRIGIGGSTRYDPSWLPSWRGGILYLPPRLLAQRLNWRGSALSVAEDARFDGKRVLIVTGQSDVAHSRSEDGGTAAFLADRGAAVEFLWLGDLGITGNGHYLMYEDNSDEIADLIAHRMASWHSEK